MSNSLAIVPNDNIKALIEELDRRRKARAKYAGRSYMLATTKERCVATGHTELHEYKAANGQPMQDLYLEVILPPQMPGHKHRVQMVRDSKLKA